MAVPRWQFVAFVGAVAVLAAAIGYFVGTRDDGAASRSEVDVGFLHDMIDHHEQAVTMANVTDAVADDPLIRQLARDVLIWQRYEIGLMDAYLSERGLGRGDPDREIMTWMGHSGLSLSEMPGLATEAEIDELQAAEGDEAGPLFLRLMREHHQGGVAMARYAADHADDERIRRLAEVIVANQEEDIRHYDEALERLAG